jgi:heme-degrading monooxygenase HmoA
LTEALSDLAPIWFAATSESLASQVFHSNRFMSDASLKQSEQGGDPMFGRMITLEVQPGKIDEAISIYRNAVVPAVRQREGFKGISLLVDRNGHKRMRIVIWETAADTIAGEAGRFLSEQIAKMESTFAAPPVTEHCEVSVHL